MGRFCSLPKSQELTDEHLQDPYFTFARLHRNHSQHHQFAQERLATYLQSAVMLQQPGPRAAAEREIMSGAPSVLTLDRMRRGAVILLSHPTGNRNVREALAALDQAGLLVEFSTTVSWRGGFLDRILPAKARIAAARRRYVDTFRTRTRTHPLREVVRLLAGPRLRGRLVAHETGPFSVDAVIRAHDAWAARRVSCRSDLTAVYAYEDCARDTFLAARAKGLARIYEHPVGYWREVERTFQEEYDLKPEYRAVLSGHTDSQAKRDRKDEEIGLADLIVVPSRYSSTTLNQFPGTLPATVVIPYGAPGECAEAPTPAGRMLRVVFVGSLQQRKGISYFVDAINSLKGLVETTVIGRRVGECEPLDRFISQVTWIPSAPHSEVLQHLRGNDVLVLPSLSEGFGLVVLEAMSQGLTVIVTDHTGAADVVTDGYNGYVVPVRSSESIASRLELLARDPDLLAAMKSAALTTACHYTWKEYRRALVGAVTPLGARSG